MHLSLLLTCSFFPLVPQGTELFTSLMPILTLGLCIFPSLYDFHLHSESYSLIHPNSFNSNCTIHHNLQTQHGYYVKIPKMLYIHGILYILTILYILSYLYLLFLYISCNLAPLVVYSVLNLINII